MRRHRRRSGRGAERGWAKDRAVAFYREALELLPEDAAERRTVLKRRLAVAHAAIFHAVDARLLQRDEGEG